MPPRRALQLVSSVDWTALCADASGNSDFFTIANVFESWRRASDNTNFVRTFCKKNFVSHQVLYNLSHLWIV